MKRIREAINDFLNRQEENQVELTEEQFNRIGRLHEDVQELLREDLPEKDRTLLEKAEYGLAEVLVRWEPEYVWSYEEEETNND